MTKCEICNYDKLVYVYKDTQPIDQFNNKNINLKICKKCGFLFQNPKPTAIFLNSYYSENINSSGKVFNNLNKSKISKFTQRYNFLKKNLNLNKIVSILEIGSAKLEFLNKFTRQNKLLTAVDPSLIKKYNSKIKLEKKFLENFKTKKNFNLICFFSVLEHVRNIKNFIKTINHLQNYGQKIYLEIPNSNFPKQTLAEFYNFEHISHFNNFTISYFLKNQGYKVFKKEINKNFIRILATKVKKDKLYILPKNNNFKLTIKIIKNYSHKRTLLRKKIYNKISEFLKLNKFSKIGIYGAGIHTIYLKNN